MNKTEEYIYAERFINCGSPTGLSFTVSTSDPTHQLFCPDHFILPVLMVDTQNVSFFKKKEWMNIFKDYNGKVGFPLHPDTIRDLKTEYLHQVATNSNNHLYAMPTASARTVFIKNERPFFIKLHYPYILGRFDSNLTGDKLKCGPMISEYLSTLNSHENIYFLPEISCAEVPIYKDNAAAGALIRLFMPVDTCNKKLEFENIFPAFSLYSGDFFCPDKSLNIIEATIDGLNKEDALISKIIEPLLNSYWTLALDHGLIPEAHSQNFLISKDKSKPTFDITWRDFQGFYRDKEFIKYKFSSLEMVSYHLLKNEQSNKTKIIRSFLYDWMLGFYFFSPMIEYCKLRFGIRDKIVINSIKEISIVQKCLHGDFL